MQRLAVEAAVHGNADYLKQALLLDPLTGAVCTPPEVWQLADDLLIAEAPWLPQYADEVKAAKARRTQAARVGTRLPTREGNRGSARLEVRSLEQMRQTASEERARAGNTDKAAKDPRER